MSVKMPDPVAYMNEDGYLMNFSTSPEDHSALITTEQAEAYAQAVRDEALARQATVSRMAIDNASAFAKTLHEEAQRLKAESNPEALASERQANAILTTELENLQDDLRRAKPTYYSDGYQDGWNSALEQAAKAAENMHHDSAPYWVALRIRELKKEQS